MLEPITALHHVATSVQLVCAVALNPGYLEAVRSACERSGLSDAVRSSNTPFLFNWLTELFAYQGVSDQIAWRYMDEHGRLEFSDLNRAFANRPSCPRLTSYWHFHGCGFAKAANTCAEPTHASCCPLPTHDLRRGGLNQSGYSLYLFIRDVCDGDLVGWIDQRLQTRDRPLCPDRAASMRQALLEPLGCIHGVSDKVLSMALSELLLGADPDRERWVTTGASMIAIDSLVHNWLHRSGALRRLGADHPYGARCYAPGGCADIIQDIAQLIDAREFCPDGPRVFPRLLQKAVWRFCAQGGLGICNGNQMDDRQPCEQCDCPMFEACDRLPLRQNAK
jgi:hypothetical protein